MRTKEEILRPLPAEFTDIIESSEDIERLKYRIRLGTLEALLDIRDVMVDGNIYIKEIAKSIESMAGKYQRSNK